ncbi:MAG: cysteine hydrolase [Clostridia bacterium]|nr:cysteine hydrolase [Clostridia bacterium]
MKKLLVVIDYQNDFVNGTLGFDGAEKLDGPIAERIRQYRAEGHDVVFTRDTHYKDYLNTQEGKKLPVVHCVKDTPGWQIFGETAKEVQEGDTVIDKPTFGSMALGEFAIEGGYDEVELVGLVSNICVMTNAAILKTALPEAVVTVNAALTASHDADMNAKALDIMEGIQVNVINR